MTDEGYITKLDRSHVFPKPIATQIASLETFYPAEAYHQNFIDRHLTYPYVVVNDLPKLDHLRKEFPELLKWSNRIAL